MAAAYHGRQLKFGPEYIIPTPFDPRLIWYIPPFVAQAAMDTGVARRPIPDMDAYRDSLARRLDPTAGFLQKISGAVQSGPSKRIVFAEGEEPAVIRAAYAFQTQGLGQRDPGRPRGAGAREHARRPASIPPRPIWR